MPGQIASIRTRQFIVERLVPSLLKISVRCYILFIYFIIYFLTQGLLDVLICPLERLPLLHLSFRKKITITFIVPLMTRPYGKTMYRQTVGRGSENTAAKLQPSITSRCSENEHAFLPEKEEKEGRLPFKRNFQ